MEPRKYFRIPEIRIPLPRFSRSEGGWQHWLPTPGNILFTLLVASLLLGASSVGALPLGQSAPPSTGTIAYQGRLADASGTPLTNSFPMTFRLYEAAQGGVPLWTEQWTGPNSVQVSDGLFNVMLGSLEPITLATITAYDKLWLGITVGNDDEMAPRVQLGTVPFAMQALTVPDGSITAAKLANGSVSKAKLGGDVTFVPPDGSVTAAKLANGAVTTAKLADSSITPQKLAINGGLVTASSSRLIRFGNVIVRTNANGVATIDVIPAFPNALQVATVTNGDFNASSEIFISTDIQGNNDNRASFPIRVMRHNGTPLANGLVRVHYIAIGY